MLDHRGTQPRSEREHLEHSQAGHVEQTLQRLRNSGRAEVLEVEYPTLVAEPQAGIERVAGFIGEKRLPRPEAMAACIRPELYRNRSQTVQTNSP